MDRLGVGAEPPKDLGEGMLRRKDTSSLEALRKQLLGKHAKKPQPIKGSLQGPGSALVDRTTKPPIEIDSDNEGGRTAAFTSRNQRLKGKTPSKKKKIAEVEETSDLDEGSKDADVQLKGNIPKSAVPAPSKRKASSFLDEILGEKSKRKKKKQKNGRGDTKT
jgi:hypothetical protein